MSAFIIKFWKELVLAAAILFNAYLVYDKIYTKGVEDTIAAHQKYLDEKISNLEQLSTSIAKQNETNNQQVRDDLAVILSNSSKKPTVIYKEGKCIPSDNFLDSYNSLIDRANSK